MSKKNLAILMRARMRSNNPTKISLYQFPKEIPSNPQENPSGDHIVRNSNEGIVNSSDFGTTGKLTTFAPIAILAWAVFVPVNWTNNESELAKQLKNVTSSVIDKLSISNIPEHSTRFWTHIVMAYAFTIWTCYILMKEYETVANMRLQFVASEARRPDQFTVLVRNVPPDPDESVSELVEHFFLVNNPDHYPTHQVVCNANKLADLVNKKKKLQNWLDYYQLKYSRNNFQIRQTNGEGT